VEVPACPVSTLIPFREIVKFVNSCSLQPQSLRSVMSAFSARGCLPMMLSSHNKVRLPLPGILYNEFLKKLLLLQHNFHTCVHFIELSLWRLLRELFTPYFAHRVALTGCSGSSINVHKIFPPSIRLAREGSLICSPPSAVGFFTTSQFTK